MDGLVERFHGTSKSMLRKFVDSGQNDWDDYLPYLLFAYCEVRQESTGFSPFEFLYGKKVRGPLDVLRESWTGDVTSQRAFDDPKAALGNKPVLVVADPTRPLSTHQNTVLVPSSIKKKTTERNIRSLMPAVSCYRGKSSMQP